MVKDQTLLTSRLEKVVDSIFHHWLSDLFWQNTQQLHQTLMEEHNHGQILTSQRVFMKINRAFFQINFYLFMVNCNLFTHGALRSS